MYPRFIMPCPAGHRDEAGTLKPVFCIEPVFRELFYLTNRARQTILKFINLINNMNIHSERIE